MTANAVSQIIENILITHFSAKEELIKPNVLFRDIYPNFILLSNVLLLENLISDAIGQPIRIRGKISLANAAIEEVINFIIASLNEIYKI